MGKVSQLGCSGNKLQRQKKGSWSLGGRKAESMRTGEGHEKRHRCPPKRERALGNKEVGKGVDALKREKERELGPLS